jgi:hypothetical protein
MRRNPEDDRRQYNHEDDQLVRSLDSEQWVRPAR